MHAEISKKENKMNSKSEEILRNMGVLLLLIQTAESVIKLCMRFVIQENSPMNYDLFVQLEKKEQKKTLGYFLSKLRERAEVEKHFDEFLSNFLDDRNKFIHNISAINGWDLDSDDGIKMANHFLIDMINRTNKIINIFAGFITAWQKRIGIDNKKLGLSVEHLKVIQYIERDYSHLIDKFLFKKEQG